MSEISPVEADAIRRAAGQDQEVADWAFEADKLAAFFLRLTAYGVPKRLAAMLTMTAQRNSYDTEPVDDDDD